MSETKVLSKKHILDWSFITIGVAIASFAFSFFLNPNNIVIGGVSGIGVILKNIFPGFNPAVVILLLNAGLLLIGLVVLGKEFFLKTAYGSLTFPLFIMLFDWLYKFLGVDFTTNQLDMVIIILFSSLLMGAGIGLVLKHGGTTGGTEVPQRMVFKFFHIPFSSSLYFIDGSIILVGLFLGVATYELVFYAIIFTYVCGLVMDTVIFSGFNKRAVYIISKKNEEIKNEILDGFERGVTSIKVIGEYSKSDRVMLLCVLSTTEYYKLREIIEGIDPTAFYYVVRASEVRGEGFSYVQ